MPRKHNRSRQPDPTAYKGGPALFIPPPHRPGARAWSSEDVAAYALASSPDLAYRETALPGVRAVSDAISAEGGTPSRPSGTPSLEDLGPLLARALRAPSRLRVRASRDRAPEVGIHLLDLEETDARLIAAALERTAKPPAEGEHAGRWHVSVTRGRALALLDAAAPYLRDDEATRSSVSAVLADYARHRWNPGWR